MEDALNQLGFRWISEHVGQEFRVFSHTEPRLIGQIPPGVVGSKSPTPDERAMMQ